MESMNVITNEWVNASKTVAHAVRIMAHHIHARKTR